MPETITPVTDPVEIPFWIITNAGMATRKTIGDAVAYSTRSLN